jgi:hypothetical protein
VSAPTVEATEASTDTAVEATTETAAPAADEAAQTVTEAEYVPADLTAFQSAAQAAVDTADKTTGKFADPDAAFASVQEQYNSLPAAKDKAAARKWTNDRMRELMAVGESQNFPAASAFSQLRDSLKSEKVKVATPKAPKVTVDPVETHRERVLAVRLANALVSNDKPEGLPEDFADQVKANLAAAQADVNAYAAFVASTDENKVAPEGTPDWVVAGFKIAAGKAAGKTKAAKSSGGASRSYEGPTRNVGAHIQEIFSGLPVGTTLKVSEITNRASSEYTAESGGPSSGAVSSRLNGWAKSGQLAKLGFEVIESPKSVKKVAEPTA